MNLLRCLWMSFYLDVYWEKLFPMSEETHNAIRYTAYTITGICMLWVAVL